MARVRADRTVRLQLDEPLDVYRLPLPIRAKPTLTARQPLRKHPPFDLYSTRNAVDDNQFDCLKSRDVQPPPPRPPRFVLRPLAHAGSSTSADAHQLLAAAPMHKRSLDTLLGMGDDDSDEASSSASATDGQPLAWLPRFEPSPAARASGVEPHATVVKDSALTSLTPAEMRTVVGVPWLRGLEADKLQTLVGRAHRLVLPRYSTILIEGRPSSSCFILLSGAIRCYSPRDSLDRTIRRAGEIFGLSALMGDPVANATVEAAEDVVALQLLLADLDELEVDLSVVEAQYCEEALMTMPLLMHLSVKHALRPLARLLEIRRFEAGEQIFAPGGEPEHFYFLLDGHVEFFVSHLGSPMRRSSGSRVSFGQRAASWGTRASIGIGSEHAASDMRTGDDRPWFDIASMIAPTSRRAFGARCVRKTKCLVLGRHNFATFEALVPKEVLRQDNRALAAGRRRRGLALDDLTESRGSRAFAAKEMPYHRSVALSSSSGHVMTVPLLEPQRKSVGRRPVGAV